MTDDEMLTALAGLDPVRLHDAVADGPPAPGSTRYDSILERAMEATDVDDTPAATTGPTIPLAGRRRGRRAPRRPQRRPSRTVTRALATGAAAVLTAGVVLLRPDGGGTSPAAALTRAAATTAEVTSLRGTLTRVDAYSDTTSTIEVDGDDMRIEVRGTYRDGHVEGSTTVVVGDQITQVALDGSVERSAIGDEDERPHPFGASSAAVVTAALSGGDVRDLGAETVRGVEATHYRIVPDAETREALAALSPGELAWFELEYPDRVTGIDVWVADDLIRRIEVTADLSDDPADDEVDTTTVDYYDFDADITITPPDAGQAGG